MTCAGCIIFLDVWFLITWLFLLLSSFTFCDSEKPISKVFGFLLALSGALCTCSKSFFCNSFIVLSGIRLEELM